jgi:uncharacterized protein involved in exopolysaccharide biosynthesis
VARLALLWKERRFLWGVAWKTLLVAYAAAWLLPAHYQSVAKIVPGETQGSGLGLLGKLSGGSSAAGSLGLDPTSLLGMKTPGAFYIEVMKSRTVQDRLIDRFDLRRRYTRLGRLFPGFYYGRFAATRFGNWLLHSGYYATRKQLKSFTDFEEDKRSGVVSIGVTDYDPQTAAAVANAYVSELNRLASDLNTSDAHRERLFLEERLKSAKQELDQASLELSQFSSKNTVMDPQSQGRTMQDAAARVQGELIAHQSELRGLQQIYSDANVRVRSLKARIGELQSQLRRLLGSSGSTAADPEKPGSPTYPSIRALPMLGYQYGNLYRQAKTQETVYEFLTQQYEMAKVQEAKELPTVRIMDLGVPPERKSGPFRTLIAGLSVMASLALACFWVIGKNTWDGLPEDDARRMLAAEVHGEIRSALRRLQRKPKDRVIPGRPGRVG